MDILILADFCGNLDGTDNSRFIYLANMLCQKHDVEILTSDFDHGTKSYFEKKPCEYPYKITMLHESSYPKNICLRRFYSHFVWGKNVKRFLTRRPPPDVIYCAVPTLMAAYEAAEYCKKNNVKFIVDIQDLWPEAFRMVFRIPILSTLIFAPFRWLADGIYRRADEVVAVSNTYVEKALSINKRCTRGHAVFLGTSLKTFDDNAKCNPAKKPVGELWLAYCGTLGASYDLICVFDALALLRQKGISPPKFVVMGDGPRRAEFEHYAKDRGLDVQFTGRLPYDEMCGRLCVCDIVVNPIIGASAASIINKHGDYAASGLPVLNTQDSAEYRALVEEYQMGFNCKNGDAADLAEKLEILISNEVLRKEMGYNARRCAAERFDRKSSYQELIACILK